MGRTKEGAKSTVVQTLSKGRCLVASKNLRAGEEVLSCQPDAYALNVIEREGRCSYCLKQAELNKIFGRCHQCKLLRYCSRKCQTLDWQTIHRQECAAVKRVAPQMKRLQMLGPTLLAASRLLRQILQEVSQTEGSSQGSSSLYQSIEALVHHKDRMNEAQQELYSQMAALVHELTRPTPALPSSPASAVGDSTTNAADQKGNGEREKQILASLGGPQYIIQLLRRLACNGFSITDDEAEGGGAGGSGNGSTIGLGLYLDAVAANHSCQPNCHALFEGPLLRLRTLQDVKKGEELCIGYIDIARPRAVRQKELWDSYRFHCTCQRCTSVEEVLREAPVVGWLCERPGCGGACVEGGGREVALYKEWTASKDGQMESMERKALPQVCVLCGHRNIDEIVPKMADLAIAEGKLAEGKQKLASSKDNLPAALACLKDAHGTITRLLPRASFLAHEAASLLVQVCIGLQDWHQARQYARANLIPLEFASSPSLSPLPALEHMTLGKLEYYLEAYDEALLHYHVAWERLCVTHGEENRLVQRLMLLMKECTYAKHQHEQEQQQEKASTYIAHK